jgi:hypothetical protein
LLEKDPPQSPQRSQRKREKTLRKNQIGTLPKIILDAIYVLFCLSLFFSVLSVCSVVCFSHHSSTKKPPWKGEALMKHPVKRLSHRLIFQNPRREFGFCRNWHRLRFRSGCRGIIGPVPPPLWMSARGHALA